MVPRPPLARHATQDAAAMETVARVAAVGDGAAGEVALVADFGAKLGHSRVLAVGYSSQHWDSQSSLSPHT